MIATATHSVRVMHLVKDSVKGLDSHLEKDSPRETARETMMDSPMEKG